MKLLAPLALALIGLGGGLAAGHFLKEPAEPEAAAPEDGAAAESAPVATPPARFDGPPPPFDPEARREYARLNRQFVVPLVSDRAVGALMVLTLSVEVDEGLGGAVLSREPKLRDLFLRVMFRHAQSGGFDGEFTSGRAMADLKGALLEAAQSVLGPGAHDVLVTDLVRQDL